MIINVVIYDFIIYFLLNYLYVQTNTREYRDSIVIKCADKFDNRS